MFSTLKGWLSNIWEAGKRLAKNVFITTVVPITVIALDVIGLLMGSPILISAVLAGVILVLSIFFVLLGMPQKGRAKTSRIIGKYGFWIDLVMTVVLTVIGFKLGATMGLVAMMMGLNISAMTALIRLSYIIIDPEMRDEFLENDNDKPMAPKRRRPVQSTAANTGGGFGNAAFA